jgi:hypothetical protein
MSGNVPDEIVWKKTEWPEACEAEPGQPGGWLYAVRYLVCDNFCLKPAGAKNDWSHRYTEVRAYGVHAAEKTVEALEKSLRPNRAVMAIECWVIGRFETKDDE